MYGAARVYWTVFARALDAHEAPVRTVLLVIGVTTAITAAIMCYGQRNLKRLLAFSTISHMGLMVVGLSMLSAGGLADTTVYVMGHGAIKAALFMGAGILLHRVSTVDEFELHGRGKQEPWIATVFLAGAAGLAGMPPPGTSAGDSLIHEAAKHAGLEFTRWISFAAAVLTSAAIFRATARVFLGWGPAGGQSPGGAPKTEEKRETTSGHEQVPLSMYIPPLLLGFVGILLGFVPGLTRGALHEAARFTDSASYAARVLAGIPSVAAPPDLPIRMNALSGLMCMSSGLVLGIAHRRSAKLRKVGEALTFPLELLRAAHSGHVADYVVWLMFGTAACGCVWLFAIG